MIRIEHYARMGKEKIATLVSRPHLLNEKTLSAVKDIETKVLRQGDQALLDMALSFDRVGLTRLEVAPQEYRGLKLEPQLKKAIDTAFSNISKFHKTQRPKPRRIQTSKGVVCWQEFKAIERVGLYVPGGSAPLFSTALMLAIPAMIARCQEIYISSPPGKDGKLHPAILYAAKKCKVTKVFKAGGAGAVFAFAYGTQSIPKVDKIFGPGNQYVTAAKMAVSDHTAIDMPAGPSEVLVIADKTSNPAIVAADLLAQAEHGADSQSVLVTDDIDVAHAVNRELGRQIETLPRAAVAASALEKSFCMVVDDMRQAMEFSNIYAPEHLIIGISGYERLVPLVTNAGSVFLGPYASESFGDYASGTNHTLPTSGFARSLSGISLLSFGKLVTFQEVSKTGLDNLGHHVEAMAEAEGLTAHKNSVTIRMNKCEK